MSDESPTVLDDAMPTPEGAPWTAIIECESCGYSGQMYATHRPERETQWWDCKNCGVEDGPHRVLVVAEGTEAMR